MERIQSAIAKARAERAARLEVRPPPPPPPPTQPAPPMSSSAKKPVQSQRVDVWPSLRAVELDPRRLDDNRIVAHKPGAKSRDFDLMRTNLMRKLQEQLWTRVAITSPGLGCGKTTLTLNLAFSLSRLSDLKILVLELDLRRPSMMKALGLKGDQNFAAVLAGKDTATNQVVRVGTNLAFGLTSAAVQSPAELLSSLKAADLVDSIEAQFTPDVVLIDLPPMLVGDDTIAFLDQVDCALMVAAAEKTSVSEIDQCGKELAQHTQVLGVVLNKCRMMEGEDYSQYA